MHAANLLNKRRQQAKEREEKEVPKVEPHKKHVNKKTISQTSFLDSIGDTSSPSQPRSHSQHHHNSHSKHNQHHHTSSHPNNNYFNTQPLVLYHKPERITCAHIGLCVMICGTIVTIIAGFICYLLGLGEPGVVIGCGGGVIICIGLVLLSCGNRCHLDERLLRMKKLPVIESLQFSVTSRDSHHEDTIGSAKIYIPTAEAVAGDILDVSKLKTSVVGGSEIDSQFIQHV